MTLCFTPPLPLGPAAVSLQRRLSSLPTTAPLRPSSPLLSSSRRRAPLPVALPPARLWTPAIACDKPAEPQSASPADDKPADEAEVATPPPAATAEEAGGEDEEQPLDEPAMRAAEIHEVLTGLREFKSRIINDATRLAKKVRAPKKQLEAAMAAHPDIIKIDGHIAELEEELKVLGDR